VDTVTRRRNVVSTREHFVMGVHSNILRAKIIVVNVYYNYMYVGTNITYVG